MLHSTKLPSVRRDRLARELGYLLLALTSLSAAYLTQCSSSVWASAEPWQSYARTAGNAFSRKDYQTAEEAYKRALSFLSAPPDNEAIADVRLNLAEIYIQSKQLELAKQQLELVRKIVHEKSFDPLLPVRFYRRESQLYAAQGKTAAAIVAYALCTQSLSDNFSNEHRRVKASNATMSALLDSAIASWNNQSHNDQFAALVALSELESKALLWKPNRDKFDLLCSNQLSSQIKKEEFENALQTLELRDSTNAIANAKLWLYWWWLLTTTRKDATVSPKVVERASNAISRQLPNGSDQDVKATRTLLLAGLAYTSKKHELAHDLIRNTPHNPYERALTYECRSKISLFCFKQACRLLDRKDFGALTEQYLLDAKEVRPLTDSITPTNWKPINKEMLNLVTARLYLSRNQIARASAILDKIPPPAQQRHANVLMKTYANMVILLAEKQSQTGDRNSCTRKLKAVSSWLATINDEQLRAEISQMLNAAKDRIEKASAEDQKLER